jgi:hypothetical protein
MESEGCVSKRHLRCKQELAFATSLQHCSSLESLHSLICCGMSSSNIFAMILHTNYELGIQNPSENDIFDYGLHLLDNILHDSGRSLAEWPSMPLSQQDWNILAVNHLIAKQLNYN